MAVCENFDDLKKYKYFFDHLKGYLLQLIACGTFYGSES
jgi:hypothetical protein